MKKETWYTKGGYESTIFIPATPDGELRKRMQRKVDKTDMRIKVIYKTGNTLKRNLQDLQERLNAKMENV